MCCCISNVIWALNTGQHSAVNDWCRIISLASGTETDSSACMASEVPNCRTHIIARQSPPFRGMKAGKGPQCTGTSLFRWWWPSHRSGSSLDFSWHGWSLKWQCLSPAGKRGRQCRVPSWCPWWSLCLWTVMVHITAIIKTYNNKNNNNLSLCVSERCYDIQKFHGRVSAESPGLRSTWTTARSTMEEQD